MKELIDATLKGDKLYFEYITCTNKEGTVLKLKALAFIIE